MYYGFEFDRIGSDGYGLKIKLDKNLRSKIRSNGPIIGPYYDLD